MSTNSNFSKSDGFRLKKTAFEETETITLNVTPDFLDRLVTESGASIQFSFWVNELEGTEFLSVTKLGEITYEIGFFNKRLTGIYITLYRFKQEKYGQREYVVNFFDEFKQAIRSQTNNFDTLEAWNYEIDTLERYILTSPALQEARETLYTSY